MHIVIKLMYRSRPCNFYLSGAMIFPLVVVSSTSNKCHKKINLIYLKLESGLMSSWYQLKTIKRFIQILLIIPMLLSTLSLLSLLIIIVLSVVHIHNLLQLIKVLEKYSKMIYSSSLAHLIFMVNLNGLLGNTFSK